MKIRMCYEDNEGRRHDTPEECAKADRILAMRTLSREILNEWANKDYSCWRPEESELSVILQRLAMSKGFAILRKVQAIQRKEARIVTAQKTPLADISDYIPF